MCQIIPIRYKCCRRVYVEISKLPSCSEDFPKVKCPPDLCIQIGSLAPEAKAKGMCWRCQAEKLKITDPERELMRPEVDSAREDLSSLETTVGERREAHENDGKCWFCHSRGGCKTCGALRVSEVHAQRRALWREQDQHNDSPSAPSRKRLREPDLDSEAGDKRQKRRAKNSRKVKLEKRDDESTIAESSAMASARGHQQQQPYYSKPQNSSPHLMPPATPQYRSQLNHLNQSRQDFANRQGGSPVVYQTQSSYPEASGSPLGSNWYPPNPPMFDGLPGTSVSGWQSVSNISPVNRASEPQVTSHSYVATNDNLSLVSFDPSLFEATTNMTMNANDFGFNGHVGDFTLFPYDDGNRAPLAGNDDGNRAPLAHGNPNLFGNFDFQSGPSSNRNNRNTHADNSPHNQYPLQLSPDDLAAQLMSPFDQYPEPSPDLGN